jgi:c-di-GMP-binding flagellar brake protein YcgR
VASPDAGERLAPRYRTIGLHWVWLPQTKRWNGVRRRPARAEVVDLSVGGALFHAQSNPMLAVGSVVPIESGFGHGVVQVRHVHEASDPGHAFYGVLFLELDDRFRRHIHEQVAQERGDIGRLQWAWELMR